MSITVYYSNKMKRYGQELMKKMEDIMWYHNFVKKNIFDTFLMNFELWMLYVDYVCILCYSTKEMMGNSQDLMKKTGRIQSASGKYGKNLEGLEGLFVK